MVQSIPKDNTLTIKQLVDDPYPYYQRFRNETPVIRIASVGRIFLTKAEDTKAVKANPSVFSSDDPNTPMKRAFQAHTLMRKDDELHRTERMALMPTFNPKVIEEHWIPIYRKMANQFLDSLPRGEVVDLFPALAGPLAGRFLGTIMGMPNATDDEMQFWSQSLIDGAGNFGWLDEPFELTDRVNQQINTNLEHNAKRLKSEPDPSALSVMIHATNPLSWNQMLSNVKIAIGGGINEPRDALLTVLFGLLSYPEQLEAIKATGNWLNAFEEGIRWVAPIQVSSRLVTEDTEIRDVRIEKGETVMTIQASANRDEALFINGEDFDALRSDFTHQSFGNGPHHCPAANLSRKTVAAILLPLLFERFPDMKLVNREKVVWKGFGFRGPLNLPVLLQ